MQELLAPSHWMWGTFSLEQPISFTNGRCWAVSAPFSEWVRLKKKNVSKQTQVPIDSTKPAPQSAASQVPQQSPPWKPKHWNKSTLIYRMSNTSCANWPGSLLHIEHLPAKFCLPSPVGLQSGLSLLYFNTHFQYTFIPLLRFLLSLPHFHTFKCYQRRQTAL